MYRRPGVLPFRRTDVLEKNVEPDYSVEPDYGVEPDTNHDGSC